MVNLSGMDPNRSNDRHKASELYAAGLVTLEEYRAWACSRATVANPVVKLPEHCSVCNHHNPYVGTEHVVYVQYPGVVKLEYICRQCKPKWEREQNVAKLKREAEERAYEKANPKGVSESFALNTFPPYRGPVW